jgi:hydroxyethylthiazole kinase
MNSSVIQDACEALGKIRREHPLVHNITNYVVMNFTANALLAIGASPVMAHAIEEVEEMVGLANALVINIGTLSSTWVESMFAAARAAGNRSIPVVLDPVGAGATRFRTEIANRLADEAPIAVIRGNASEIMALAGSGAATRGVDSLRRTEDALLAAGDIARQYQTVVAVTGVEDYVTDGRRSVRIANGHATLARITGTGCAASAITGAFCAVQKDFFVAAAAALITFGIAGELAASSNPGPGSFQPLLLDALDALDADVVSKRGRVSSQGDARIENKL